MPVDSQLVRDAPQQAPLHRYPVVRTSSLEQARDAVARVYLPHELTAASDRIDMTLNAVSDHRFTLGYLSYQAATELVMPATKSCYHVNLTTRGSTDADRTDGARERTDAGSRGLVLSPVQRNTVRWTAAAEQLILKIPRSGLETHLSALIGRPVDDVLDFDFGLDLASGPGRTLLQSVRFLADELDRPDGLAQMQRAREQLEDCLLTQLLHAGRHQYTDALQQPATPLRLGRLAPVVEHMQAHADQPLTPTELARVGYMSVRTLHTSFQATFGESPMSYLRRLRLDHVRAELVRSDPAQVRVTDVAMRWGFFHQSRFAQQYRQRFGELPSHTLRS